MSKHSNDPESETIYSLYLGMQPRPGW